MRSTLVELLFVLKTLTHEPIDEDLPMVLIAPKEAMPCACEAAYDKGHLYIRNDINWTDPRWLSIVLHELEHHRQFALRGEARDCAVAGPGAAGTDGAEAISRRGAIVVAADDERNLPVRAIVHAG